MSLYISTISLKRHIPQNRVLYYEAFESSVLVAMADRNDQEPVLYQNSHKGLDDFLQEHPSGLGIYYISKDNKEYKIICIISDETAETNADIDCLASLVTDLIEDQQTNKTNSSPMTMLLLARFVVILLLFAGIGILYGHLFTVPQSSIKDTMALTQHVTTVSENITTGDYELILSVGSDTYKQPIHIDKIDAHMYTCNDGTLLLYIVQGEPIHVMDGNGVPLVSTYNYELNAIQ